MTPKLISDYITSHLSYDPITGIITNTKNGNIYTNSNTEQGYIAISLKHRTNKTRATMYAHRIAYCLYHGVEPDGVIDHIDSDRTNNKIDNIRLTNKQGNAQNMKARKNKTTMVGVDKRAGNYRAKVSSINIGTYTSELDAHYVSTYYKQLIYTGYTGSDLTDISGKTHPYFTGKLYSIICGITDTKGKPATSHLSK